MDEKESGNAGARVPRWVLVSVAVLLASLVVGGLESWAQGLLPHALKPLANSASGWSLVTVLLVHLARVRPAVAAPLAVLTMALLLWGYTLVSGWRGYGYDPTMWLVISVVVGPFVGLAAAWLHERGVRAALGAGAIAGVCIGEGIYGLRNVADTTGSTYWIGIGVVGVALLVAVLVTRVRGAVPVATLFAVTAATVAAFLLVYTVVGGTIREV